MLPAVAFALGAAATAAAPDAPEYRFYTCKSGIDVTVTAIGTDAGTVLVMAPEGRQLILLPEGPQGGGTSLHVEQPAFAGPTGLYLWRERPPTPDEAAQDGGLVWLAELAWRDTSGERLVYPCRRLPL